VESKFNKIKQLMQGDNKQPLPPELDWDHMKDGIFDKIQSIEQEELPESNNKDSEKGTLLFLILFFALMIGLMFIPQNMKEDQTAEAHGVVQIPETDRSKSESNTIEQPATIESTGFSEDSLGEKNMKTQEEALPPTFNELESNQDPTKSAIAPMNGDQPRMYQPPQEKNSSHDLMDTDLVGSPQNALNTTKSDSTPSAEATRPPDMPQIAENQSVIAYVFDPISPEKTKISILDIQKIDSVYPPATQPATSPNQLIFEGGVTFWNEGYGSNMPERAQYETPLPSFQLQGHYMRRLNKNFFVMAGLQYQQLESRFDYSNTIQDYKIILEDTIIQVQNNVLTGEQNIIRGDVEVLVPAERKVIHYNQSKLFRASIGLGKSWRFHSFQTDVYLGGALNSLVHNQGRTFNDDTLIDYNGASNSLFANQLTVDGILGARLHYFLSPKLGLTTGIQAQKSLMNWSNQDGMNFYPLSFGLQFGLSYSL
jgi:hypothetical protein